MLKKLKARLKKANNRGSSFVLVIVSTSFLCILISSLLMGMLLAYKLKYYRLNSLNNFYSVEKAMDEIYAGIGASTNEHLYSAYTTTAELVVYYKTDANGSSGYTYLSDDEANDLFRQLFIQGFADDDNYSAASFLTTIEGFISDSSVELSYDNLVIDYMSCNDAGIEGHKYVKYSADGSFLESTDSGYSENDLTQITFKNVCVTRDITVNSSTTDENYSKTADGNYVQSITTDIVLTEPEFNVSFDITASNSDSLYSYALLADMGLEVSSTADNADVTISGNVYTATDYYNKDYNGGGNATKVTNNYTEDAKTTWGTTNDSLYSGIYVNGENTSLTLMSDVIVCSGTLAAFNGASISLGGATGNLSELWTDNIVIGGTEDGSITMAANAYVYDDTELNAEGSSLTLMSGRYFGYSYSSEDLRSIDYLKGTTNSLNTSQTTQYLTTNYTLKSHFGDSAIIVNGEDSALDLAAADSLYIAGKSYIEFSRLAADSLQNLTDEQLEEMGLTSDDILADYSYTTLLDYSTGQSLDVKSNQLIFLANWTVGHELTDAEVTAAGLPTGYTYVTLQFPYTTNKVSGDADLYADVVDLYSDLNELNEDGDVLYAIKQEVSGHNYYYLYIDDTAVSTTDTRSIAESFVEKYYAFVEKWGDTLGSIYNVVNYESFTVSTISLPDDDNISTGGAVTATNADNSLYVTASTSYTTLNVGTALKSASTSKVFTSLLGGLSSTSSTEVNSVYEALLIDSSELTDSTTISSTAAAGNTITNSQISDFLNYMYLNLKHHLSVTNTTDDAGNEISAYSLASYSASNGEYYSEDTDGSLLCNYSITPLTYFVNYERIFDDSININKTIQWSDSGSTATVIVSYDDVTVNTDMSGIIISGGNVTFGSGVTSFTGLIICGGKIYCDHTMTIKSSENMVVSILDKCAEDDDLKVLTTDASTSKTRIIRNYENTSSNDDTEVSGMSISDISYYDILAFQNWKKNVE